MGGHLTTILITKRNVNRLFDTMLTNRIFGKPLKGFQRILIYQYARRVHYNGYILRIDCGKAEEGLITTPCSQNAFNALAIDEPSEYARLVLNSEM